MPRRPSQSTLALAAVTLSSLMFGLEISSVPVILPTLERTLGADFVQLQWVMNAYTIAVATVLMAAGALADRFGRKRLFLIGVVAFGLTSLVCGITHDVAVLIGARFLQGVAGGVMLICQVAILSHQFQDARARSSAFAWWGVIFGIGLGFGPIIGAGLIAMRLSLEMPGAGWLFLAPGLLLAGAGLGFTNTPVTNTATGAVSSDRAGMASGMDMSARMITLAINIAVMGAILFNGVLNHLKGSVIATAVDLHLAAERISAGNLQSGVATNLARETLSHGFALVMIYGGIGCWILTAASAVIFRKRRVADHQQKCSSQTV